MFTFAAMSNIVQHLFIYPIKSLGGLAVKSAALTPRGFQHDRCMMLVDDQGRFLSQREHPKLALFKTEILNGKVLISATGELGPGQIVVGLSPEVGQEVGVEVWTDSFTALTFSDEANLFFSEKLNSNVRLVYMPDVSKRYVDRNYAEDVIYAFSDAFPILLIGSASLDDLNNRLAQIKHHETMGWDRFRPNVVVATSKPFEEDHWKEISIRDFLFQIVKPCSRCVMTTINQTTAANGKEPLRTLSSYRTRDQKVLFGQNVIHLSHEGEIFVGDSVQVNSDHF